MKNYTQIIGVVGLLFLFAMPLQADSEITFLSGKLEVIQQKAGEEGKLYMVDFVAKWCLPCKWMDETTFSDPAVTQYLTENYIPTKVDIDNFDGFEYKSKYNIEVLPTILIFNSKGEIVGRYEESMAPSKMLEILATHNNPENREIVIYKKSLPSTDMETYEAVEEAPDYSIEDYEVEADEEIITEVDEILPLEEPAKIEVESIQQDLFKLTASPAIRDGFSVQVGVYADYGNVLIESAKFQATYNQEVIVQVTELNNKQVFKLLVGEFSSKEEAHNLRRLIEEQGGEGITKDLSKI